MEYQPVFARVLLIVIDREGPVALSVVVGVEPGRPDDVASVIHIRPKAVADRLKPPDLSGDELDLFDLGAAVAAVVLQRHRIARRHGDDDVVDRR